MRVVCKTAIRQCITRKTWNKRQLQNQKDDVDIDAKLTELRTESALAIDKIKYLKSETAIKYTEEELMKLEEQMTKLLN